MEGISAVLAEQFVDVDFARTRFLVVGGNGYLGYKLVEALVGRGAPQVRVFDRIQTRFKSCPQVDFYLGDICDPASVELALRDVDVIYHAASCFGNPPFGRFGEGKLEWLVNVEGTRNVIAAARAEARRRATQIRLVYIGSSAAIFSGERDLIKEREDAGYPTVWVDHYGRTKAIAEQEVMAANAEDPDGALLTCVLRPNGIYGEGEPIHIPRVRKLCSWFFDVIPADFASMSDWTFADNLIFACFLAVEKMRPGSPVNGTHFNITDGELVTIKQFFGPSVRATGGDFLGLFVVPGFLFYIFAFLLELVCFLLSPLVQVHSPFTTSEALKICRSHSFSIEKAKMLLGYVPIVSTEQGIARAAVDFEKRYRSQQARKALS